MIGPIFDPRRCGRIALWVISWLTFPASALFAAADAEVSNLSTLQRIDVQPPALELHGPRDRAIVLVTGHYPNGTVVDLTRRAQITSSDTAIVEYRDAAIRAKGDGHVELTVQVGSQKTSVPVVVSEFDQPVPISF